MAVAQQSACQRNELIEAGREGADFEFGRLQVSQAQQTAQKMTEDFASGQDGVNLQDVMINLQKASLSFQEMVQVRNRLVTAYQNIMNIQV